MDLLHKFHSNFLHIFHILFTKSSQTSHMRFTDIGFQFQFFLLKSPPFPQERIKRLGISRSREIALPYLPYLDPYFSKTP
jgi:hypothetical protein